MNMNIDFNVNMYNSYIYFASFCFAILLDHLIVNNYLGISFKNRYLSFRNNSYLYINLILFIVFLIIYYFFFNLTLFDVNITDINDLIFNMSDKNDSTNISTNIGTNSTVNIHDPKFNATVGDRGINNIAAALSAAGGASIGLKVAQHIGGTPSAKLAAGLATMAIVQAGTGIMSKILNSNNNNIVNKLVSNFIFPKNSNSDTILNNYPLNLLEDVNLLLYAALLFLIVIFNIYLVNYIIKKDFNKYLPKNKLGKILNTLINRYINIWSKTTNFFLIFCYVLLFISVLLSKICLYIIIKYYN